MNQTVALACCQPLCLALGGCSPVQATATVQCCSVTPCAYGQTSAGERFQGVSWECQGWVHCFLDGYCLVHAVDCYLSVSWSEADPTQFQPIAESVEEAPCFAYFGSSSFRIFTSAPSSVTFRIHHWSCLATLESQATVSNLPMWFVKIQRCCQTSLEQYFLTCQGSLRDTALSCCLCDSACLGFVFGPNVNAGGSADPALSSTVRIPIIFVHWFSSEWLLTSALMIEERTLSEVGPMDLFSWLLATAHLVCSVANTGRLRPSEHDGHSRPPSSSLGPSAFELVAGSLRSTPLHGP